VEEIADLGKRPKLEISGASADHASPTGERTYPHGIWLKLAATLAFSLMYAAIKLAGPIPLGEVIFFRSAFSLLPLFLVSLLTVGPRAVVYTRRPFFHVARSAAGVCSMFLNFAALALLPLATITAFSFVAPIFAVALAAAFLHERVGVVRWMAVCLGFAGVLVMLASGTSSAALAMPQLSTGAGLALCGALLSAFVVIFIRQMSTTELSETIVFYFMIVCAAAGALNMLWHRTALNWQQAGLLIAGGVVGGIGQICMTYSYRFAQPSLLAPFDYVAMVWATALGYLIFAEVPGVTVMIGAAIVVAAGLLIIWRERHMLRAKFSRATPLQLPAESDVALDLRAQDPVAARRIRWTRSG
jgi:drug/metabolite transporter (DMT)-like permease